MIRYGDEQWRELKFIGLRHGAERRDGQWVDVILRVETAQDTPLPDDLIDFSILAVCTHAGHPIQLVTQDEEMDCEYQLTESEQEQINAYLRSAEVQADIVEAALVR
ncbi:hypothetical protein ACFPPD_02605 [Cohnella suwonensis]|uniref:PIN domain-containing protein n=1 Tax=Cohnella suwonensis TaxID=696072 RepID=A0ABW0LQI8_9BACL